MCPLSYNFLLIEKSPLYCVKRLSFVDEREEMEMEKKMGELSLSLRATAFRRISVPSLEVELTSNMLRHSGEDMTVEKKRCHLSI